VITVITTGGTGNASNDFKVKHFITGNVVDPNELKSSASKIEVCRGTNVSIAIVDDTGTPTVVENSLGISCTSGGCTILDIQSKQQYRAFSEAGDDKDRITINESDAPE
jgi:hypothetical protein